MRDEAGEEADERIGAAEVARHRLLKDVGGEHRVRRELLVGGEGALRRQAGDEALVLVVEAARVRRLEAVDIGAELAEVALGGVEGCLLYTSPSPRDS